MTAQAEAAIDMEGSGVSGALVPLSAHTDMRLKMPLKRPDASFVTQLIATAEHAPQTRTLRRGSYADAQTAYGPPVGERRSVTRRTKQII